MIAPPQLVVFDTSTLVSLAVDDSIQLSAETILHDRATTAIIVREELKNLRSDREVGDLATRALAAINWLGTLITIDDDQEMAEIERVRTLIAAGHPLRHPGEHMGESALIVASKRLGTAIIMEDRSARMIAKSEGVVTVSLHRALHHWIADGSMTAVEAKAIADLLQGRGRGQDYTVEELTIGGRKRMGSVWDPEY